jgi:hypothetical protein
MHPTTETKVVPTLKGVGRVSRCWIAPPSY